MASRTPTSELSDAAQSAGRRRASIAPRAQRRGGTPQCRRLHHARGSSGAPARGQAARERRASGVAAEPRARAACAPAARACAQATRRGGALLRPFERCPASVVVGGGGWQLEKNSSAGFPESGEVFFAVFGPKRGRNATIGGHAPRGAVCAPLGGLGRSQALGISTRRVFHGETSRYGRCLPSERVV